MWALCTFDLRAEPRGEEAHKSQRQKEKETSSPQSEAASEGVDVYESDNSEFLCCRSMMFIHTDKITFYGTIHCMIFIILSNFV